MSWLLKILIGLGAIIGGTAVVIAVGGGNGNNGNGNGPGGNNGNGGGGGGGGNHASAPELDPSALMSAGLVVAGGVAMLVERRRRNGKPA